MRDVTFPAAETNFPGMDVLLDFPPAQAERGSPLRRQSCFPKPAGSPQGMVDLPAIHLEPVPAEALARLLDLLVCGEEAASIAFDGLAEASACNPDATAALRRIADEERGHEGLIKALAGKLPAVPDEAGLLAAARRFHIHLGRGDQATHLARIAALDSAVCTLLARLLRPASPLAGDAVVGAVLRRIGRDEARHVRVSRTLASAGRDPRILRTMAAPAREALVKLLVLAADDFEKLECDPDRLFRDLARLPDGLFGV